MPPTPASHAASPPLPELAGGRPRRLLIALATLEATDAAYRAVDVAVHLKASQRWAVRLVVHAEGPLLSACHAAGLEVQRVDARPVLAATTPEMGAAARLGLQREVWWGHLDAVAVFDPECFWVLDAANRRKIPTVVDCSRPLDPAPRPGVVAAQMRAVPEIAARACFSSPVIAAAWSGNASAVILPTWPAAVDPGPSPLSVPDAELLHRALEQLARYPSGHAVSVPPFGLNLSAERPAVRPLLDAALAGRPIVTVASPVVAAYFRAHEVAHVAVAEPLVLAHVLLDLANNPGATARRVEAARRRGLALPPRESLLHRWQALLEDAVRTN